jgi:hypothetical protein
LEILVGFVGKCAVLDMGVSRYISVGLRPMGYNAHNDAIRDNVTRIQRGKPLQ